MPRILLYTFLLSIVLQFSFNLRLLSQEPVKEEKKESKKTQRKAKRQEKIDKGKIMITPLA